MERAVLISVVILAAVGCLLYMRSKQNRIRGRGGWSWRTQLSLCVAVFAAAMYLQLYLIPVWMDSGVNNFQGGSPSVPPQRQEATMSAIEKYKKFVANMGGRRKEQQGNAVAVMQAHHRVEEKRYAENANNNDDFASMAELYRDGLGSDTARGMSTAIHNDLEQSLMSDRNVPAMKARSFTDPGLVGEYNRGSQGSLSDIDAVPQATGGPFRATTGLSPETAQAGPRATESDQSRITGRNAALIQDQAASSGLMATTKKSKGGDSAIAAAFETSLAADDDANETAMQQAIEAASSR